jgi:RimJ/RimL family protein N-acetyltransferase
VSRFELPVHPRTDGVVTVRVPTGADVGVLIAGRDAEFYKWLAAEDDAPPPAACVEVDGVVVGWVDWDTRRSWLEDGEVNIGYYLLAGHRGHGYVTRAVRLLLDHLVADTDYRVATFAIATANSASLAVAERLGAEPVGTLGDGRYFKLRLNRPY